MSSTEPPDRPTPGIRYRHIYTYRSAHDHNFDGSGDDSLVLEFPTSSGVHCD